MLKFKLVTGDLKRSSTLCVTLHNHGTFPVTSPPLRRRTRED